LLADAVTTRNDLYHPTYYRRAEWARGWEPPTRATYACSDASCIHYALSWQDDLPQRDPIEERRHWPRCASGHLARIIDVDHSTIPLNLRSRRSEDA